MIASYCNALADRSFSIKKFLGVWFSGIFGYEHFGEFGAWRRITLDEQAHMMYMLRYLDGGS